MSLFRLICLIRFPADIPLDHIVLVAVFLWSHAYNIPELLDKWLCEEKESLLAMSIME